MLLLFFEKIKVFFEMPQNYSLTKKHIIAFDLSFNTILKHFIPHALIIEQTQSKYGYFVKNVNPITLDSYKIDCDASTNELIAVCKKLQTESLCAKYNFKNKTPKTLDKLLEDANLKRVINEYIELQLEKFLSLIKSNNQPLAINFDKQKPFEGYQVFFAPDKIIPKLYFHKTDENLEYKLSLLNGQHELIVSS